MHHTKLFSTAFYLNDFQLIRKNSNYNVVLRIIQLTELKALTSVDFQDYFIIPLRFYLVGLALSICARDTNCQKLNLHYYYNVTCSISNDTKYFSSHSVRH